MGITETVAQIDSEFASEVPAQFQPPTMMRRPEWYRWGSSLPESLPPFSYERDETDDVRSLRIQRAIAVKELTIDVNLSAGMRAFKENFHPCCWHTAGPS